MPPKAESSRIRPKKRRTIKSSLSIHDKTQIEAVFDYYLFRGSDLPKKSQKLSYQIDAYFFFPQQFGLSASTYSKIEFFNDIRPLIRLREPKIGLKELSGQKAGIYPSPLKYLDSALSNLSSQTRPSADEIQKAVLECRIFACVFIGTLLRNVSQWEKKLKPLLGLSVDDKSLQIAKDHFAKLSKFSKKVRAVLLEFHQLQRRAKANEKLEPPQPSALFHEINLADEYLYYRTADALSMILKLTGPLAKKFELPEAFEFHSLASELMRDYTSHAEANFYRVITPNSTLREREDFLKRRSELKRRLWAVFFLSLRTTPFFPVQQQLGPMLAAGLAAIWAAFAQLFILDKFFRNQNSFSLLEVSSLIIVFSAMFAYIIKDRIKEIGRNTFKGRIFRRIPDQSETIYYQNEGENSTPIGRLTESAQFIKPRRLPKVIQSMRAMSEIKSLELEDNDDILHYSKEVTLDSRISVHNRYPTRVIHDILRFNIDACLPRLAEPHRTLPVILTTNPQNPDPQDPLNVQFIECPKTYTFDLVLQYSGRHEKKSDASVGQKQRAEGYTKYYRLTLDKTGLLRIKQIRTHKSPSDSDPLSSKLSP